MRLSKPNIAIVAILWLALLIERLSLINVYLFIGSFIITIAALILLFKHSFLTENTEKQSVEKASIYEHNENLHHLFEQLERTLAIQINTFETELDRNTALVREAVANISASFTDLQRLTEQQNQIINQVIEDKNANNPLSEITPKITEAVSVGIRSLQFEDLTYQSLNSLKVNIALLKRLKQQVERCKNSDSNSLGMCLEELVQTFREISLQAQSANKNRTVVQSSMKEGDVELF